jgi:hypothetical protein
MLDRIGSTKRRSGLLSRSARPLLENIIFLSQINVICAVQPLAQKQFPSRSPQISTINPAVSSLMRGGSRVVTDAGWEAVDAAASA